MGPHADAMVTRDWIPIAAWRRAVGLASGNA